MKILISVVIAVAAFFVVGLSLVGLVDMRGKDAEVWASIAGIVAFVISMYKVKVGKSGIDIVSDTFSAVKQTKENIQTSIDSKHADLYATAEEEYEKGEIDKGLWSQALVKAKGDEKLRKVEYMKLRVMQLKQKR